ncbi:MAG: nitrile hydratase subunit beta [Hyphomicrobiales bacterium]|nr:nitrile hydratase subunit beta [Hyphomicrobiales bacterium]
MSERALPGELERLLADDDGRFYADEAAARAIAIVVKLFEQEHYSWPEWVDKFAAEIDAPGYFRNSPDQAKAAEAALSGEARSIHRNYAERWLAACEKLLLEKGLVTRGELDEAFAALATERSAGAGFAIDDRVVVRDVQPDDADHLPLFVRGKTGIVERRLGGSAAQADRGIDQPLYSVRFTARDLWGANAAPNDSINFSIRKRYLAPA